MNNNETSKLIDLHIHLDGSITPSIAKKLAEIEGIELIVNDDEELKKLLEVPQDCAHLNDFLKCFALPVSLMQTRLGLKEAAHLVAEDLRKQGIIYAELRFAPQLHTSKGLSQEEVVEAVLEGLKESNLKTNLILCYIRGEENDELNFKTLEVAKKYLVEDGGVVAADLAGREDLFLSGKYEDIFKKTKELNIPFTIHAGEAEGPESVKMAVSYGAKRIGHGLNIFKDEELMNLIKEKGITLEMCPTSNIQTRSIKDFSKYPLIDYLNKGIKVTINTDDPAIEDTTLKKEFELMEKVHGLRYEQARQIIKNSIEAAFTSDSVKEGLLKELGYID